MKITLRILFLFIFLAMSSKFCSQELLSVNAMTAAKQNNFEPALNELTAILKSNPNHEAALVQRANVYIRLNKYNESLIDSEKAIKINPKNADAYFLAATSSIALEKDNQALRYLDSCLALKPDFLQAIKFRGQLYSKMNLPDMALPDLNKVIAQNPKSLDSYLYRGRMLTLKLKFVDAMNDFLVIINEAPADSPLKSLAKIDFQKAEAEYREYEKAGGAFFRSTQ